MKDAVWNGLCYHARHPQEAVLTRTLPATPSEPPAGAAPTGEDRAYAWRVLWIALFGSFIVPFNVMAVNNAVPVIARDLGLGLGEAVWVQNAFLLTVAVLLVPVGRIADTVGRARIYVGGVTLIALGSLGAALAPSGPLLFLAQIVQGIGSAGSSSTSMALVTAAFPPRERGRALGLFISSVYLGSSLGPSLGGFLTANFGWRSVWSLAVVVGPLVALAAARWLRREPPAGRVVVDWGGAAMLGGAMVALMAGLTRGPSAGWGDPLTLAELLGAAALVMALIVYEVRREAAGAPTLVQPRLFRERRAFSVGILTALLNYSALFATSFLTASYLQVVRGLRADETGLLLLSTPVTQTLLSPVMGWLSDRVGARPLASGGMAAISAGLLSLALLPDTAAPVEFVPRLALIGFGMGCFSSPNSSAVMGAVDGRDLSFASSAIGAARQIGQNISLAGLSAVAAAGLPAAAQAAIFTRSAIDAAAVAAFAAGIHRAFLVAACVAAVGIVTSLVRGK